MIKVDSHTTDLVLSMRALMVLFRWASFAGASVKTKISEEGGAAVRASCQSYTVQDNLLETVRLKMIQNKEIIYFNLKE